MDEIRKTALAYYANLPQSLKQEISDFFKSLDRNGDEKIDLHEFIAALNQLGISDISNNRFFKELDKDGNGSLDFREVITLFYIIKSGRLVFCDGCGEFLKGVYFTCASCFKTAANSFDLCCTCYHINNFHHHGDAIFLDNYVLLRRQWASLSRTQASQSLPSATEAASTPRQSSKREALKNMVDVAEAGNALYGFGQLLNQVWEQLSDYQF